MLTCSSKISSIEDRSGQKISLLHRQPPAPPAFYPSLLFPAVSRSNKKPMLWVSSIPRRWQMGSEARWPTWAELKEAGGHSFLSTVQLFLLCLQSGLSRTNEARTCTTESEGSLHPPSPNEGAVGVKIGKGNPIRMESGGQRGELSGATTPQLQTQQEETSCTRVLLYHPSKRRKVFTPPLATAQPMRDYHCSANEKPLYCKCPVYSSGLFNL